MERQFEAKHDAVTVTAEGKGVAKLIAGVVVREATTQVDERGELCEIYDPRWGLSADPLVYLYYATIRPGMVKGWVYHEFQDDRLFVITGNVKAVLYDPRDDSPTKGLVNEIYMSERRRRLLIIPRLVVHVLKNVGTTDAIFINTPTLAYNHDNPDKYRVSSESMERHYSLAPKPGW